MGKEVKRKEESKEKTLEFLQEFPCPLYLMYCSSLLRGENETHFSFVKREGKGK